MTEAVVKGKHGRDCGCHRCRGAQPRNALAMKEGAYSDAQRLSEHPRTAELAESVRATQPVSHDADDGAIQRLAIVYRRIELANAAIEQADQLITSETSEKDRRVWLRDDLARWISLAGKIEAELGRTPSSRAKLGLHIALGKRTLSLIEHFDGDAA